MFIRTLVLIFDRTSECLTGPDIQLRFKLAAVERDFGYWDSHIRVLSSAIMNFKKKKIGFLTA